MDRGLWSVRCPEEANGRWPVPGKEVQSHRAPESLNRMSLVNTRGGENSGWSEHNAGGDIKSNGCESPLPTQRVRTQPGPHGQEGAVIPDQC